MAEDILEKARKRFDELSVIITRADEVRDEHTRLQNFLVLAAQVSDSLSDKALHATDEPPQSEEHQNGNGHHRDVRAFSLTAPLAANASIPDRAERILKIKGPMHLSDLFNEMRTQGWRATGNDTKDKRNLAASLWTRKGDRFVNLGNNTWQAIPEKERVGR